MPSPVRAPLMSSSRAMNDDGLDAVPGRCSCWTIVTSWWVALPVMLSMGMLYVVPRSMAVMPVWSWCWFSVWLLLASREGDAVHDD